MPVAGLKVLSNPDQKADSGVKFGWGGGGGRDFKSCVKKEPH